MEPKGSQSEPRNVQKPHLRNRVEKVTKRCGTGADFWKTCCVKINKELYQESIKKRSPKNIDLMPKGCQNGAKFYLETYQKPMPKL